jgi:hypothetical protein
MFVRVLERKSKVFSAFFDETDGKKRKMMKLRTSYNYYYYIHTAPAAFYTEIYDDDSEKSDMTDVM